MGDDHLTGLRAALYSGDGQVMMNAVREHGRVDLQLAGDVLLLAVRSGADGARDLVASWSDRLGDRAWEGDDELAEVLRAAASGQATDTRPELAIDIDQLSGVLEGDPAYGGGRIDLRTGEVWPEMSFQDADADGLVDAEEDPDRWLAVWPEGSRNGYRDMVDFAGSREEPKLAAMLEVALDGRGAFRRFKNVLIDYPQDRAAWFAFSDDRSRGRARAWLAGAGYRAVPDAVNRHGTIDV